MPLYEYQCQQHGVFEDWAGMACASHPASCPFCRAASPRILSAVRGAQLPASELRARDRNERSRHEPRVVAANKRASAGAEHGPKLQHAHGSRPWAIEHS